MESKSKDFDYELAFDSNGRCNGVVWQTGTMRENFKRFGPFISLDAMKRAINKLLWPYFAVAMINNLNKICIGCEALLCAERDEAYEFLVRSLITMSNGWTKQEVYAVAGDGFITPALLKKWDFPNAQYISDYWHLFNHILPN